MTKNTILIVDDDAALVEALSIRSRALGLEVETAYDAREAIARIRHSKPDLIFLDMNMPWGGGWRVCEIMAASDPCRRVPTIMITGDSGEETIRKCFNLSVIYVEKSADMWPHIKALVCKLLHLDPEASASPMDGDSLELEGAIMPSLSQPCGDEETPSRLADCQLLDTVFEMLADGEPIVDATSLTEHVDEPPWILCIDDDETYSMALKLRLEAHGVAVVRAFDGMEGLRSAFGRLADVILLDYEMPGGRGDYILRRLKDNPVTKDIPVIVITGTSDHNLERKMLALGAAKFMTKPIDFNELAFELSIYIPILSRPARATMVTANHDWDGI